ncbi:MAG TPA: hypothetical protein VM638_03125 [Actinomycetota bacterium]|nr:hypothetical protein [Actinomycetota bacterium]
MTEPPAAPGTPPPQPAAGTSTGQPSGAVMTAGILQIVIGGLIALFTLYGMVAAGGAVFAVGAAAGMVIIILLYGLAQLLAGIFTVQRKNVGRILGMVLGVIGALLFLLGMISSFNQTTGFDFETGQVTSGMNVGGVIINLLLMAANVVIVILLARNGREFTR